MDERSRHADVVAFVKRFFDRLAPTVIRTEPALAESGEIVLLAEYLEHKESLILDPERMRGGWEAFEYLEGKLDEFTSRVLKSQKTPPTQKPQIPVGADVGADTLVQWYVDRPEVKRAICKCIDNEDWRNACRLVEAVEMMVEKHKAIQKVLQQKDA